MIPFSHHAHIFIGDTTKSRSRVFEYIENLGLSKNNSDLFIQEFNLFTVEDARKLKQYLSEKSHTGNPLVALVFTENFMYQAQNALLKTFEEPCDGVFIFFVIPYEHLLLPTFKSRAMIHYLKSSTEISPIDISVFHTGTLPKKFSLIDAFLKKKEDEEPTVIKREVQYFFDAYEEFLYNQKQKISEHTQTFDAIFFGREYLHDQGSSVKQLLEIVAVS